MKIDHIGYAVKNIDKARMTFESLGYKFEKLIEDNDRNIYIQFCEHDGYRIELVSKMNKALESPVDGILRKVGPTAYHICYKSEDFANDISMLTNSGFKLIIAPEKAIAFEGRHVAFLINFDIGLIEIVEE